VNFPLLSEFDKKLRLWYTILMTKKLTTEQFIERARLIHGFTYDYSNTNYINNRTKITIVCPTHGAFIQLPSSHLQGNKCKQCYNERISIEYTMQLSDFVDRANTIHNNKYDYGNSQYTHSQQKIEIICSLHGSFFQVPANHLKGQGCPKCNSSKGEMLIRNFLILNQISFSEQWRNNTCKDTFTLPFDFYLPDYKGEQHYYFVPTIQKTVERFYQQQKRDDIKRNWAKDNNIALLEISYQDKNNIDNILATYLNV
jgi:hypothetical protein